MRILLVAGSPAPSSPELIEDLALNSDAVIAIDRGATYCRKASVTPKYFCGDADTIDSDSFAWIQSLVGKNNTKLFNPAKDDTDLSLGFSCARSVAQESNNSHLEVWVTCASSGRMDHALAVFGVLAQNADLHPRLFEDGSECRILSPGYIPDWAFDASAQGSTFSFVALSDNTVVSENGMHWNLDHYQVDALRDRGISNVIESPSACITCHKGIVAAFLFSQH